MVQTELRRIKVKDIPSVTVAAESLVDYWMSLSTTKLGKRKSISKKWKSKEAKGKDKELDQEESFLQKNKEAH